MPENNNLYSTRTGRMIKSDGSVVNEADGVNEDGSRKVQLTGNSVTEDGRVKVDLGGASLGDVTIGDIKAATIDVTLQDAASTAGNGTAFTIGAYKTLTIEITGTSTSRTIVFEGASVGGTYYPVMGVNMADFKIMGTSTTGNGEVWQFGITGLVSFRARITAIAGGNVTIKGKAVA